MRLAIACLFLLISSGLTSCSSEGSDQEYSGETVTVDGVELKADSVADLMDRSGMTAEEAERFIQDNLARRKAREAESTP